MALRQSPVRCYASGSMMSIAIANSLLTGAACIGLNTPFAVLVGSGALLRLALTLPLSLYGDQCVSRAACALPELQEAYYEYLDLTTHPHAVIWQRRVAAMRLQNDRRRIFSFYRTSNVKANGPTMAAAALTAYAVCGPVQQLGHFFLKDADMAIVSPWAMVVPTLADATAASTLGATATGAAAAVVVDPTMAIAAALSAYNCSKSLNARCGFHDERDAHLRVVRRGVLAAYAAAAALSLLSPVLLPFLIVSSSSSSFSSFLAVVAPAWLGISAVSFVKTVLVQAAWGRALLRISDYPPTHGTYGTVDTGKSHHYVVAMAEDDVEERQRRWRTQKRLLDFECDVRLHRMVSRLKLFDEVDDVLLEADSIRERLVIARGRRHRDYHHHDDGVRQGGGCSSEDATGNNNNNRGYSGVIGVQQKHQQKQEESSLSQASMTSVLSEEDCEQLQAVQRDAQERRLNKMKELEANYQPRSQRYKRMLQRNKRLFV